MSVEDVFRAVQHALAVAGIPYMITGSFASSVWGEPRASKDIDIVIAPARDQLATLIRQFPQDQYYAVEEDALEAFDQRSMFNIIDFRSGWRIDFIMRKARPFSETEFSRRREHEVGDLRLSVASPEDVLIAKLEWAKLGESERQLEDAAGIIRLRGSALDVPYIEHWVSELGLQQQWQAARRRSEV